MVQQDDERVVCGLSSSSLPALGMPNPPISQQSSLKKLGEKHEKNVSCQVGELNGLIMTYKDSQNWLTGEARRPRVSGRQSSGGSQGAPHQGTCIQTLVFQCFF